MRLIFPLILMVFSIVALGAPSHSAIHPCEKEAIIIAAKLLRLHHTGDLNAADTTLLYVAEKAILRPPVKAPLGKGLLDVLEFDAGIYKTKYRLRFLYAQVKGSCGLMGQEILEMSNPY